MHLCKNIRKGFVRGKIKTKETENRMKNNE